MADTTRNLRHPAITCPASNRLQQMGGFARLKTAIERESASAQSATFLVDSGDAVQGCGPAAWSQGAVVIIPLNSLGLDAFVPEIGKWCMAPSVSRS